jgi:hypothetical protein
VSIAAFSEYSIFVLPQAC